MLKNTKLILISWLLMAGSKLSHAEQSSLSTNIAIVSKALGYSLQYRVYTPANISSAKNLPSIYFVDGQMYLAKLEVINVLDKEIAAGRMEPVLAVFVDSRDPDNLSNNRRNSEFMCNKRYVQFFTQELIPQIGASYPVSSSAVDRVIAGISFGGLNAACFGLMAADSFGGIGMQSPASDKHLKIMTEAYEKMDKQPIKMFFSIGTVHDNTEAARKFHRLLQKKQYQVTYLEVPYKHEWRNWKPLIDDLLLTFFASSSSVIDSE
jgi:enterochelin esterase-like enzyme